MKVVPRASKHEPTTLLSGPTLWPAIISAAEAARGSKYISTAYLGPGILKQFKLAKADAVHCALSVANARCGAVYPHDLRDAKARHVRVFASPSLHAKVFLLGKVVIIGSANLSSRSRKLDEA